MNTTSTPRTDAVANVLASLSLVTTEQYVLADFARQLETELQQARADMKVIVDACAGLTKEQEQGLRAELQRAQMESSINCLEWQDWERWAERLDGYAAEWRAMADEYVKANNRDSFQWCDGRSVSYKLAAEEVRKLASANADISDRR